MAASGVVLGLDYTGVAVAAPLLEFDLAGARFHDLQAMEMAALEVLNGRARS